jgi:signal transduction histidine kinase/CheY-like chemotaxis protein
MLAVSPAREAGPRDTDAQLADLRQEILRPLVLLPTAAALYLLDFAFDRDRPETWLPIAAFAAVALGTHVARGRGATAAALCLTLGLHLAMTVTALVYPGTLAICFFATTVAVASALLGPQSGFASAAAATATIVALRGGGTASGDPVVEIAVGLAWMTAILSWLASRPVYTALGWAWHSHQDSLVKTEQLRDHQVQLGRVSKSLRETIHQLEVANHELERARRAADVARRVKAEFAAAISHELRTPLNLIIGFSEMMVIAPQTYHGEVLPEGYRGDLEAIYRSACHLSSMVDDVLDLAEVEAHRMALEKEWRPLGRIVDEAVTTVATLFKDRGLSLAIELSDDLPPLYVDRTRVRQILINLLTNAARFTAVGGVTIRARREGGDVAVSVQDTGIGIPPDELPSIFKEFHHSAGSVGPYGGRGLGLAICRRLVELHGGSMWVESSPNEGSTFYFTLPLYETVVPGLARDEWETWVTGPVEEPEAAVGVLSPDDAAVRLFQRYLDGYRVVAVAGIDEARRLAGSSSLRALVLAAPDGRRRLAELADSAPELAKVPIVSCPLHTRSSDGRELGVASYLVKPIDREQLGQAFRSLGKEIKLVAIVDDDPEMVRLLSRMVRSLSRGMRSVSTTDGGEALELLERTRPDVVLLDLLMPGTDGYAIIDAMKRSPTLAGTPVIVASAWGAEQRRVTAPEFAISRADGLSVAEVMRWLRAVLEVGSHSADQGTPVARPG